MEIVELKMSLDHIHYAKSLILKGGEAQNSKLAAAEGGSTSGQPDFLVIWESLAIHLEFHERMIFLSVACFVIAVALIGNLLTLYVVFTR